MYVWTTFIEGYSGMAGEWIEPSTSRSLVQRPIYCLTAHIFLHKLFSRFSLHLNVHIALQYEDKIVFGPRGLQMATACAFRYEVCLF